MSETWRGDLRSGLDSHRAPQMLGPIISPPQSHHHEVAGILLPGSTDQQTYSFHARSRRGSATAEGHSQLCEKPDASLQHAIRHRLLKSCGSPLLELYQVPGTKKHVIGPRYSLGSSPGPDDVGAQQPTGQWAARLSVALRQPG